MIPRLVTEPGKKCSELTPNKPGVEQEEKKYRSIDGLVVYPLECQSKETAPYFVHTYTDTEKPPNITLV